MIVDDAAPVPAESKPDRKMDLGEYLQKSLMILQLDRGAIEDASKDEDALLPALLFVGLVGVANGAAQFSFGRMIFGAILAMLLSFVLVGLLNVLARLFGSSSSFLELYRPLGLAASLQWVQAVPFIGPFLGVIALLYTAVVAGLVVEVTGNLPRSRAGAVIAILAGVSIFLFFVFFAMLTLVLLFRRLLA